MVQELQWMLVVFKPRDLNMRRTALAISATRKATMAEIVGVQVVARAKVKVVRVVVKAKLARPTKVENMTRHHFQGHAIIARGLGTKRMTAGKRLQMERAKVVEKLAM